MKPPTIAIVGAGRLGAALAKRLAESGYSVSKISSRKSPRPKQLRANVVWFCVPDAEIARVARAFVRRRWQGNYAFHSSGALGSDVLDLLRDAGAHVASVHPLMTFVKGSVPALAGVPFAMEGDKPALALARQIVRKLAARPVRIRKQDKIAYHAFATMICPLLVSLLASAEQTAALAGISEQEARRRMMPIIRQTLRNYEKLGPAAAFSGPVIRGDAQTIRAHLETMARLPAVKKVYAGLTAAALQYLPSHNLAQIVRLLRS